MTGPALLEPTETAIKRILAARREPYEGFMGEVGKRSMRNDTWVNGIRAKDFDAVIAPAMLVSAPQEPDDALIERLQQLLPTLAEQWPHAELIVRSAITRLQAKEAT